MSLGPNDDIPVEVFLQAVELAPYPFVTRRELHRRLDLAPDVIDDCFAECVDRGYLERRPVGDDHTLFWLTDPGADLAAEAEVEF